MLNLEDLFPHQIRGAHEEIDRWQKRKLLEVFQKGFFSISGWHNFWRDCTVKFLIHFPIKRYSKIWKPSEHAYRMYSFIFLDHIKTISSRESVPWSTKALAFLIFTPISHYWSPPLTYSYIIILSVASRHLFYAEFPVLYVQRLYNYIDTKAFVSVPLKQASRLLQWYSLSLSAYLPS